MAACPSVRVVCRGDNVDKEETGILCPQGYLRSQYFTIPWMCPDGWLEVVDAVHPLVRLETH